MTNHGTPEVNDLVTYRDTPESDYLRSGTVEGVDITQEGTLLILRSTRTAGLRWTAWLSDTMTITTPES